MTRGAIEMMLLKAREMLPSEQECFAILIESAQREKDELDAFDISSLAKKVKNL